MVLGFYQRQTIELPHPPIALPVLLVMEAALCAAWDLMRAHPRAGFNWATATEDGITLELHEALFDRIFDRGIVAGFNRQLFSLIVREPKVRSYNYKHLDKMPDLLIGLVGRPAGTINTQDGLFIECKPVDLQHGVGGHYYRKGLIRFVRGEYAWAMTEAMMIGYARPGYTIDPKLKNALKALKRGKSPTIIPVPCSKSRSTPTSEFVHSTTHPRRFRYRETGEVAPPITIRHLWLQRD